MAEDLLKKYTFAVDSVKATNGKPMAVAFSQGDVKTAILIINLTENDTALDLTGKKVRVSFKKSDGTSVMQDMTTGISILDAAAGKIQIELSTQALSARGNVRGQISITDETAGLVAETAEFTFVVRESIINTSIVSSDELPIIEEMIEAKAILATVDMDAILENNERMNVITSDLAQNAAEVKKNFLKPYFVEFFASFNRFGLGVPSGIANYSGGMYVVTVSGNAGESVVTVTSGNISHGGGTWACVIQFDDGTFQNNRVTGISGSTFTLLRPLKKNITNGKLGNLHDAANGQHYTELGYYAFAQHIYFANPRYAERNEVLSQFLPYDTSGNWVFNGVTTYNNAKNMTTTDGTFSQIGNKRLFLYCTDNTKYAEYTQTLDGKKGYVEVFVGGDTGEVKVEFYLDDVLADSYTVKREVERVIFPYEYATKGKIKIIGLGAYPQYVAIGMVTWFVNQKYSVDNLITPDEKVVFIGDSWGEYHNKATTRELTRLMTADGGTPTVLNFSKGGHSSDYARAWFQQYVIDEKPNKVILEYFTNDFNSIGGTVLQTYTAPDGTQKDMNIATLNEYIQNMQWMIDKAIEYGIQPIVIMPAATNSETQTQSFANYANQIWLGTKIVNDSPSFKTVNSTNTVTDKVSSKDSSGAGTGTLQLVSKEINNSLRKGIMSDSGVAATLGDLHGFYNNGVRKAGIKADGTIDTPYVYMQPKTTALTGASANSTTQGIMYVKNNSGTADDEVHVVLRKADGTYGIAKIPLIWL